MTTCLAALILACAPAPHPLPPPGPATATAPAAADPWFGQDKTRHLGMSAAATLFAFAGARAVMGPEPAARTGAGVAFALGIGKEIHDHRAGGRFSVRDVAWNVAGVALGFTLAQRIR